ncbi:MAG: TolC family protein [Sporomusaceae bacterium]|nr:TolC family protein [Sporomusaceae bacterium]
MRDKKYTFLRKSLALLLIGGSLALVTPQASAAALEISLDDSIAIALKNNPAIRISESSLDVAASELDQAKNGYQPQLSYSFSAQRIGSPSSESTSRASQVVDSSGNVIGSTVSRTTFTPRSSTDKYDNKLSLSVPLYTGGKLEGTVNQMDLNYQSSQLALENTRQQIRYSATVYYYAILEAQNMLKVNQEAVRDLKQHLKNVEAQYAVGTVAKSDVLQSQVNLANAEQNLIKAENAYQLSLSNMNNVMGISLDTELKIKDTLKYTKYQIALADATKYALAHRPDKAQSDLAIASAKEGVTVANSGYKPTVTASGMTDWNDTKFAGTSNYNWVVGVSATWNIFDGGITKAQVKQATASVEKATHTARQTSDTVILDVQQAYLNLREAEKRIATTQVAVDQAEENYRIAQVRYSSGVGTNTDVMDAETNLTTAKTNAVQALYDYNTSKAQLDKAMGIAVAK